MQQFIFFLWITLISVTCSFGQKRTDTQKLRQQEKILKGYSAMDNKQKLEACKEITGIWFDKIRYTPEAKISRERYNRNEVFPLAFELTNKNNRYDKKIVYFNSREGKISKVLDLQKLNPYTKAKTPGLDENMRYIGAEMNHISVIDDQGQRQKIEKYVSIDGGGWNEEYLIWCFRKYALNNKNKVIDEWNTFLITNSIGIILMKREYNLHSFRFELNEDASYFIIHEEVEGWDKEGFIITDVKSKEIEYQFKLEDRGNIRFEGARFSDNQHIVSASISSPNNNNSDNTFYQEKMIIDLEKRIEYKYSFTKEEWTEVVQNWEEKYKTYELLLNYFDFSQRSF